MSKLYNNYLELKKKSKEKVYIFKSGIFYLALEDDALKLSKELGFKVTNLNEKVVKCGFPIKRLEHYTQILKSKEIEFEVIDSSYGEVNNYSNYIENLKVREIINNIKKLDMNEVTLKQAFDTLYKLNEEAKTINLSK